MIFHIMQELMIVMYVEEIIVHALDVLIFMQLTTTLVVKENVFFMMAHVPLSCILGMLIGMVW